MTKVFINIFVLLVFAMQVLPVKQVGGLLFGNQIAEEIIQDIDDTDEVAKDGYKTESKSVFINPQFACIAQFFTANAPIMIDLSIVFPHNHSTDIYSPPPNSIG